MSNLKILFGIVVPLIVMFTLVFLSTSNIGLNIEFKPVESINFNSLFSAGGNNRIVLANLVVTNNFFLPRTIEANKYRACFYSTKLGSVSNRELYLYYTPSKSQNYYNDDLFGGSYGRSYEGGNIEVGKNSKREVELYANTMYDDYNDQKKYYVDYDKILLISTGNSNKYEYDFCTKLTKSDINNAASIEIKDRSSDTGFGVIVQQDKQKQPPFIPAPIQ